MFEQEINETIQRIIRDVLQDRTVIPLMEILEDPRIPDRFKAFFETEARWWVYTESVARARDRRFDFAHAELASLLSYLEGVQVRHARFERDDFIAVLDSAVKLTYNYLCRPQTTLKWYVFRGEPTKSIGETLLRMDAFIDYPYFRTVFTEWVDRKKEERPTFDSISSREFERIIRRIDDQILLSCTIDDLLGIMTPLFDFIGKGEALSIPIEGMIVFFDDKNIRKLVDFLERERGHRSHVSRNSFVILMEELLSNSDEEPEADFSSVYQDDTLDKVVRDHLEGGGPEPEEPARAFARSADESHADEIVVPAGAARNHGMHDEEDRWEEEGNLSHHEVLPSEAEAPPDEPQAESAEAPPASASGMFEIGDEPTRRRMTDSEEDSLFFDPPSDGGDPIFDLLIESTDGESWMESDAYDEVEETEAPEPESAERGEEKEQEEVGERKEEVAEMEMKEVGQVRIGDAVRSEEPEEFHIAPVAEDEEALAALLTDEEREPQEEERPIIVDGFGAAGLGWNEEPDEIDEMKGEIEEVEEVEDEEVEEEPPSVEEVEEEIIVEEEPDAESYGEEWEGHGEEEEGTEGEEKTDNGFAVVDEPVDLVPNMNPEAEEEVEEKGEGSGPEGGSKSGPEDVRNYIDAMLERKVVKKIFNRNRENYEETLNRLNGAETWREASRILDEMFIRYDVDPYSRIAIRFTDSVYGRYLSPIQ